MTDRRYHSRPRLAVVLKGIDRRHLTAQAVLTVPAVDYAGDLVEPAGGVWDARPYVNVEHRVRDVVGSGTVEMKSLDGVLVPVGTTHFRKGDRLAEQTFRLVADDVMTGVSLEFTAIRAKSMGHRSPLEPRDAMHFERWRGLGWAHCVQPVNPDARTLAVEKAIRVAELGRIGSEPLHPVLLKSLTQYLTPRPAAARVPARPPGAAMPKPQTKALDDDDIYTPPSDEPPPPPLEDELPPSDTEAETPDADEAGGDSTPTAKAAYTGAQGALDLADQIEEMLGGGEHTKGKKKVRALVADLRAIAEDFDAVGQMVDADVAEPDGDSASDSDGESEAAGAGEFEPDDMKTDKGLLVTKSGYKPARFKLVGDSLVPAESGKKSQAAELAELKSLQRELRRMRREDRHRPTRAR